jgi:hypothetical protein
MSIEVKQLIIKSHIVQQNDEDSALTSFDKEQLLKDTLAQCRQLVLTLLREHGER